MVGTGALIHDRSRILLIKRKFHPNKGKWALPGGLVELGERVEDAVRREILEETGLRIKLERLLDVLDDVHLDKTGKVRFHYILIDYLAKPLNADVRLNDESSTFGWFKPDELRSLNATKNTKAVVARYVQKPEAFTT
jgi:ADP-ribose pyrophosphatase YjhB (NUDIX family)